MTDLLQENLLYLYQEHENIFNRINSYIADANNQKKCKLEWDDQNRPNLSYVLDEKTYQLYNYDSDEINEWAEQYKFLQSDEIEVDILFFGLGLTHHLVKLMEFTSKCKFFIYEPNLDVFIETLKVINVRDLLTHPQIRLFNVGATKEDQDEFIYLMNLYAKHTKVDAFIPFYSTINSEDIKQFYETEYLYLIQRMTELGFETRFKTLPYRNNIRNIEHVYNSASLSELENKFNGCTALIVGGGPSLEHDIELIRQYKDQLLIIAAGSSIQALLHNGIEPHLLVSMDPGEANGVVFKNVDTSNIPLVFFSQIYYEITNIHHKLNYHAFYVNDEIVKHVFADRQLNPTFRVNPTVSGAAMQIAYYLGASHILLAGQDLSFPNKQYYSSGVNHISDDRLMMHMTTGMLQVENVQGGMNETNYSMKITLEDIERLVEFLNDRPIINTSSMGAVIKGAPYKPLTEVLEAIEPRRYEFNIIRDIVNNKTYTPVFSQSYILERIDQQINYCNYLIKQCDISASIIKTIDSVCRKQPNKAMTQLAKLENEFSQVTQHDMFRPFIEYWNRGLTRAYDQRVIEIEKEQTIVGKSKLLNEIVSPYIKEITTSFIEIKEEFEILRKKII